MAKEVKEVWQAINPPTGDEKPQKYQSGSYLNEEIDLRARIRAAAVTGGDVDLEGVHPLTVVEVAPHLLDDQKPGLTQVEAHGDIDTRVEFAVDTAKLAAEAEKSNKKDDGGVPDETRAPFRKRPVEAGEEPVRTRPKQNKNKDKKKSPAKKVSSSVNVKSSTSASTEAGGK